MNKRILRLWNFRRATNGYREESEQIFDKINDNSQSLDNLWNNFKNTNTTHRVNLIKDNSKGKNIIPDFPLTDLVEVKNSWIRNIDFWKTQKYLIKKQLTENQTKAIREYIEQRQQYLSSAQKKMLNKAWINQYIPKLSINPAIYFTLLEEIQEEELDTIPKKIQQ
ncbi:hypothetical protein Glove_117g92 [Diversispora epigaea]|uniref:Uncharacterized protein n=1 Tax=Diversispora epigaea TaxID=1348612 RepID=A0A397J997_9GLOM|nr:hypothetical protein Glove_117g92 [Diversispora epigaea]